MGTVQTNHSRFKEVSVQGRYVVNEQLNSFFKTQGLHDSIETIGYSVEKRPIFCLTKGTGPSKVLMWSQMHGNETTTTKAVLDLINFLCSKTPEAIDILKKCTLKIIPMMNTDGAANYTRANANGVDLNRDAQDLEQPESKVLRTVFEEFQPDFCFNLHDQRTIFNVGNTPKPATVSFLAPAHDPERTISKTRAISMQLIVALNYELQKHIPGQVGRYDDGFNANCVGDAFQMLNTPTILFEAGHYPNDYERENTRAYIFYALLTALNCVATTNIDKHVQQDYFSIPENKKQFFDVLVKNVLKADSSKTEDIGILFTEVLKNGGIVFKPTINKRGDLKEFYGHKTYNYQNKKEIESLKNGNLWSLLHL